MPDVVGVQYNGQQFKGPSSLGSNLDALIGDGAGNLSFAARLKAADIGVTVQGYSANTTIQGNSFNGNSQLVQTDSGGKLPALNASALTSLPSINVQSFTGNGTWTKPAGAMFWLAVLIGCGGPGGSGRKGAAGTVRCGGGGGSSGGAVIIMGDATVLGSTEGVVVNGAPSGGASQTTNSTNGNAGTPGGNTTFAGWQGIAGAAGAGGTNATGTGGAQITNLTGGPGTWQTSNLVGASASTTGLVGTQPTVMQNANTPCGGGSGGGITSADVASAGGAGGTISHAVKVSNPGGMTGGTIGNPGQTGAAYTLSTLKSLYTGLGGSGGGSSISGNAGKGGDGGTYGGAGGGGGAALDSTGNSGAGGAGGPGFAIVITWCQQ